MRISSTASPPIPIAACRRCASAREDIPLLAEHFLGELTPEQMEKPISAIASGDGVPAAPRVAREHP